MFKYTAIFLILILISACNEQVCDFQDPNGKCEFISSHDVEADINTIVLVYMPGSFQENVPDPCYPEEIYHGAGVPKIVRDAATLLNTKYPVKLLGYCTPSKTGNYNHNDNTGIPKVEKRSKDIVKMLNDLTKSGIKSEHIFLIGHSAGGWSSLLAKTIAPEAANSVIAIAPAFAGKTQMRPQGWNMLRFKHIQKFKNAPEFNALIISTQHDEFENTQTLSFFKKIKSVKLKAIATSELRSNNCPHRPMHDLYIDECFRSYHKDIARFIDFRLMNATHSQ